MLTLSAKTKTRTLLSPTNTHTHTQLKVGVDDPLDSGAVHFGNGLLGTMMLALFAKPEHVSSLVASPCGGVFYTHMGWLQLGMQTLGECACSVCVGIERRCVLHMGWLQLAGCSWVGGN